MEQAGVLGKKAVCFGLHHCFWEMTLGANNILCPGFISSKIGKSTPTWLVKVLRGWEGSLLRGFPANVVTQGQAFLSVDFFFFSRLLWKSHQGGFSCWKTVVSLV